MEISIKDSNVEFSGKCPTCDLPIVFSVENDMRKDSNRIAGSIYEAFLGNNEVCFSCMMRFNAWIKEHKEFCKKHNIGVREVANQLLKKLGKAEIVGIGNLEEEATEENEAGIVGETQLAIQNKSEVTNG